MLEINSGQDTDERRGAGALLYHSLDVGIQNWLEAHWEPPTIAKISPCKTALGGTNCTAKQPNPFSDNSGWSSLVPINSVNGDSAPAG